MTSVQEELQAIKERNERVEKDKAWETSWVRRTIITLLTYFVVVVFFFVAELPKPFLNSIVPAGAFLLSTLTLEFFKRKWLQHK